MPPSHPFGFYVITWGTLVVAVGVLTVGLVLDPGAISSQPLVLAEWTILVSMADWVSVPIGRGNEIGVDLPLLLAAAFLWGPIAGGAMALVGSTDHREWHRQVTPTSALFNHSQVAVSVMSAGFVFSWAGGTATTWPGMILPALLGLFADVVVNTMLFVVGTRLKRGTPWREVLSSMNVFGSRSQTAIVYFGFGSLAVVLVSVYRDAGGWALAEFVVPFLLARQAIRQGSDLRQKQRILKDMTLQIAEERQDERTRIASALHDDVQQALYNVTLHAEVIREELNSGRLLALEDDIPALLQASQRTRSLLREVIRGLRRSDLGVGGLSPTLRSLVQDLSSRWAGQLEAHIDEVGGSPQVQLLVYQIAREALQNAVRHSSASLIQVRLFRESAKICLLVADDGRGFIPETVDPDQHFGLEMMRERAHLAGGFVDVRSKPYQGTRLVGVFPRAEKAGGC